MSLVNFREIRDRFTHLDAAFESCTIALPGESHYAVRLYPWWEHPDCLAAVAEGASWEALWPPEAMKTVTVYPRGLIDARVRPATDVIDWEFLDTPDQRLWPYEVDDQVICGRSISMDLLLQLASEIARRADYYVDAGEVIERLDPLKWRNPQEVERPGGFSLGRFPLSLLDAVHAALTEFDLPWVEHREPLSSPPLPVMFLIDGEDYIVADDFDVDVPDFVHGEGWIKRR